MTGVDLRTYVIEVIVNSVDSSTYGTKALVTGVDNSNTHRRDRGDLDRHQ